MKKSVLGAFISFLGYGIFALAMYLNFHSSGKSGDFVFTQVYGLLVVMTILLLVGGSISTSAYRDRLQTGKRTFSR